MTNFDFTQQNDPAMQFTARLENLARESRTFASCVRLHYLEIERAINKDVPLVEILHSLLASYNVKGSLAGLKSALHRIRKARIGVESQKWLDENASEMTGVGDQSYALPPHGMQKNIFASVPSGGDPQGMSHASMSMNSVNQAVAGHQSNPHFGSSFPMQPNLMSPYSFNNSWGTNPYA